MMRNSLQERLHQLVEQAFAVDGWLVSEGFQHLPQQEAYAYHVASWLCGAAEQPVGVMEASTGIGKSIGYLIPAFLWAALTGSRVAISTFTIHLQRQLLKSDIIVAQRYLRSHGFSAPTVGQFLGRSNYLSSRRIERLMAGASEIEIDYLQRLKDWSEPGSDGTLPGFLEYVGDLPAGLSARDVCLQSHDADDDSPIFQLQRKIVSRADVVVTSHAVMVLKAARARNTQADASDILPPIAAVIYDEADRLESAASFLQRRLTLKHLIESLENILREQAASISAEKLKSLFILLKITSHLNSHLAELPWADSTKPLTAENFQPRTWQLLKRFSNSLKAALIYWNSSSTNSDTAAIFDELVDISAWLECFSQSGSAGSRNCGVMWSPKHHFPSLYEYRIDPQSILSNDIRYRTTDEPFCRRLFTSATLSDANATHALRFKSFLAALRIQPSFVCCEFSCAPDHFGNMEFVLAAVDGPVPFEEMDANPELNSRWLAYCVSLLHHVAQQGPALVLTSSYEETARLSALLQIPHIAHSRGVKAGQVISAFQKERTMLITPAAWEGVSLRCDDGSQLFRELVITRLPFARTREEELAALRQLKHRRPGMTPESIAFTRRLNEVKRKLQQGMGRGIRSAADACRVWIADSRFPHPGVTSTFSSLRSAIPERFWNNYESAKIFTRAGAIETRDSGATAHAIAMNYL